MGITQQNLNQRVTTAFLDPETRAFADEYVKDLRDNWRTLNMSQSKAITYIVLMAGAFELLARGAIDKASFLGLEFQDLSIIRKALPVLIAYFFYEYSILHGTSRILARVHSLVLRITHPNFEATNLDTLLFPPYPSIRGPLLLDPRAAGTEESKTLRVLDAAFNNILGVGIIAFEVYAYVLQFQKFEAADRLIWIMLILTIVLIVSGLASGFQYNKAARR